MENTLAGMMDGNQGGGASTLDSLAWASQVQLVRHAGSQEIMTVADIKLDKVYRFQFRRLHQVAKKIGIDCGPAINTHTAFADLTGIAGLLQRFPGTFQEE